MRLLTFRSSARIWAELHEKAFRRLGGTTRLVVLDNLREGVLSPDVYDPRLNPLYRDVLAHYGVTALPSKVRDPDRKGKIESAVGHTQKTPLKGKRFESLEEAQAYLDHWEEHWADTRIHGRTKRQVATMFAEEKPSLQVLPLEPFRYYQYGKRTVHIDGCVEVDAAYYGAPPGWIGRQVDVQWDAMFVRLLDPRTGMLLREHLGQKRGGHRIRDEDRPRRTPPHTHRLLARAHKAGPSIGTLCDAIHHRQAEAGVRRIMGVLSLAKKYGCSAVDQACAAALELGVSEYRFVRRYLERSPQAPLTLRQVDPLIRELIQYREPIAHLESELVAQGFLIGQWKETGAYRSPARMLREADVEAARSVLIKLAVAEFLSNEIIDPDDAARRLQNWIKHAELPKDVGYTCRLWHGRLSLTLVHCNFPAEVQSRWDEGLEWPCWNHIIEAVPEMARSRLQIDLTTGFPFRYLRPRSRK